MNPERWSQVDSLLDAALNHAPEERTISPSGVYGRLELEGRVESLLVAQGIRETSSKRRRWKWRAALRRKLLRGGAQPRRKYE